MFKRVIAGVLSAVLCTSALLYDMPLSSREPQTVPHEPPSAVLDALTEGPAGSNAFARYLTQKQADNPSAAQSLKADAAESRFAVEDLEFDAETGLICAVTTQSEDCKLIVSFTDQDRPANVC